MQLSAWKLRFSIQSLLILIVALAALFAIFYPPKQVISATDAKRIAMQRLAIDLAERYTETPKILDVGVKASEWGMSWPGSAAKPSPSKGVKPWLVEIGFALDEKTTGKGSYKIAPDGTVIQSGWSVNSPATP
jgi:hypothetical protein